MTITNIIILAILGTIAIFVLDLIYCALVKYAKLYRLLEFNRSRLRTIPNVPANAKVIESYEIEIAKLEKLLRIKK